VDSPGIGDVPEMILTTLAVIGTDCTGSCKSNYHTIMTTTAQTHLDISGRSLTLRIGIDLFLYIR
jgi:hypothetical protein